MVEFYVILGLEAVHIVGLGSCIILLEVLLERFIAKVRVGAETIVAILQVKND